MSDEPEFADVIFYGLGGVAILVGVAFCSAMFGIGVDAAIGGTRDSPVLSGPETIAAGFVAGVVTIVGGVVMLYAIGRITIWAEGELEERDVI